MYPALSGPSKDFFLFQFVIISQDLEAVVFNGEWAWDICPWDSIGPHKQPFSRCHHPIFPISEEGLRESSGLHQVTEIVLWSQGWNPIWLFPLWAQLV